MSMTALLAIDWPSRRELIRADASEATATFAPLADSLSRDLAPLLDAELPIPYWKARLTRFGGRCPVHGTFLEFDPWSPREHRCTRCNKAYRDIKHDDWWAMGAQLWTAERAVHAAALFALRGDRRHGELAARILRTYAERYHTWRNADNVLGPSRPFFSTYLESIWLLNLCHALALLEGQYDGWAASDASSLRERLIAPSAALIDSYNEGASNRQVWNEVAISSAWCLLNREDDARQRLDAEYGLRWQMAHGLDDAGSWYEGENYHLFAHRGLWYGVQLMRALGESLEPSLDARYSAGFVAPFAGLLPDLTFPSRRDSQYASSIRQWRTAEWLELGWTHTHDRRIAGILTRLYDGKSPRRDTGRARSTADAERNTPASALTRADLSWRALLMAAAEPVPAALMPAASVCLPKEGLAVIRRDFGRTYIALEGGQLGGGHGHPDQLSLTLQTGEARWLEDPGTGSYVDADLAWYRSTLAHAAPQFDYKSQAPVPAKLVAFEDVGAFAWVVKRVDGIANGVDAERTIVVGDGYLIDVLEWKSEEVHTIELPIAGKAEVVSRHGDGWTQLNPERRRDFDWQMLARPESQPVRETLELRTYATFADPLHPDAVPVVPATARRVRDVAHVWYALDTPDVPDETLEYLARATVPAPPWRGHIDRYWIVAQRQRGRLVGVWSWPTEKWPSGIVANVRLTPDAKRCVRVTTHDGVTAEHSRTASGWRVDLDDRGAQRRVMLKGFRDDPSSATPRRVVSLANPRAEYVLPLRDYVDLDQTGSGLPGAIQITLDERNYVRTEQSWDEAGKPTATVQMAMTLQWLVVDVHAHTGRPVTDVPDEQGRLDNEAPDVNASGVQWYMMSGDEASSPTREWYAAALHVPSGAVKLARDRCTRITDREIRPVVVSSILTPDGWAMRLCWSRDALPLDEQGSMLFELVVNERPPGRERRRGQFVLSGGGGFGYLVGTRRPTDRFVRLVLPGSALKRF